MTPQTFTVNIDYYYWTSWQYGGADHQVTTESEFQLSLMICPMRDWGRNVSPFDR